MGDTSQKRARTRSGWTDEQKQAARDREMLRRASAAEVRDEKQRRPGGGFGILPGPIIDDLSLSVHARFLLGMLSRYAGERSFCWPSIGTMARTLLCSERTVLRLLKELTDAGKIERRHRYLDGAQRSSIYVLRFRAWDDVVDNALYDEPPPDTDVTPGATRVSPPGRHGCRTENDQGGDQNCTEMIPPTPQKERAPRAAVGKEPGDRIRRRPRSLALRDELVERVQRARADVSIVHPMIQDNAPWIAERLAEGWRLNDYQVTAEHYAAELAELGVTVDALVAYARDTVAKGDRIASEFVGDIDGALEVGDLRVAAWRERAGSALKKMHGW